MNRTMAELRPARNGESCSHRKYLESWARREQNGKFCAISRVPFPRNALIFWPAKPGGKCGKRLPKLFPFTTESRISGRLATPFNTVVHTCAPAGSFRHQMAKPIFARFR